MNLLVCCPAATVEGGAERILATASAFLAGQGHDVVWALPEGRFHDPQRFLQAFPHLAIRTLRPAAGTPASRQKALRGLIEREAPDVVLVSRLFDALPAAAWVKSRDRALRIVYTVFGNEAEYISDLRAFGGWLDAVITDSRLAAAAAREVTGTPPERIAAIPGPVGRPVRERAAPTAEAPLRLGYAGRLDEHQKRVLDVPEILARVASRIPFTCEVAGAGPAEDRLRQRVAELGLSGRVAFRGWLSTGELYASFYPRLDVLLHPAAWEGNPIAPREAMAHGVVPVSARFLGLTSEGALRDGETALVFEVGDAAGAAERVARLHHDRALLHGLGHRARAEAESWAPHAVGAQWAAFLEAVAERPAQPAPAPPPAAAPSGRLERIGFPAALAEALRGLLGRRLEVREAGAEWPHWSGVANPAGLAECRALLERLDRAPLAST